GARGSVGNLPGDVLNNAALTFNRTGSLAVTGVISGTGSLTQAGTGTVALSGTNSFGGAVAVNAGTLSVNAVAANGSNQPLGTGSAAITLGSGSTAGTLQYTGATATLARDITVSGNAGN